MKAYLELEMPKNCRECEFFSDADAFHELFWCDTLMQPFHFVENGFDMMKNRHPQCPLKRTPTAEDVCKALKRYWGNEFRYNKQKNTFEVYCEDGIWENFDLLRVRNQAPHLITMIGRFYENED